MEINLFYGVLSDLEDFVRAQSDECVWLFAQGVTKVIGWYSHCFAEWLRTPEGKMCVRYIALLHDRLAKHASAAPSTEEDEV